MSEQKYLISGEIVGEAEATSYITAVYPNMDMDFLPDYLQDYEINSRNWDYVYGIFDKENRKLIDNRVFKDYYACREYMSKVQRKAYIEKIKLIDFSD